jgi:hypothetical protein
LAEFDMQHTSFIRIQQDIGFRGKNVEVAGTDEWTEMGKT